MTYSKGAIRVEGTPGFYSPKGYSHTLTSAQAKGMQRYITNELGYRRRK